MADEPDMKCPTCEGSGRIMRPQALTCACGRFKLAKPYGLVWAKGEAGKLPHSMKGCPEQHSRDSDAP